MIATNSGSFPWRGTAAGADLERAMARREAGEISAADLRIAQDRVVREVVDAQVAAGLDLVTDGLVRREDPIGYLARRLAGMTPGERTARVPGLGGRCAVPVVESEIAWEGPILVEDHLFARDGCPRPVKVVLAGPYTLARLAEDRSYGDPMALAMGLAAALNRELRALQAAGAGFIQVEEPLLLAHRDDFPIFTRVWEVLGRGVSTTLALNLPGGEIGDLYPAILRLKRLGCLCLDAGRGPAPLEALTRSVWPEGVRLGVGVVDGSDAGVESPESIVAGLAGVAGLLPQARILIGPASDLGELPPAVAAAKLASVAKAARMMETRA
ncbi:MAG: hypothetical protein ACE5JH_07980 [Acidobacteriota bacterium]